MKFLTEIVVPGAAVKSATYEVRQKTALDWPLATASVALEMNGRTVKSAKIVLGHVAPAPWGCRRGGARSLAGKEVTEATAEPRARPPVAEARPLSQNASK